MKTILMRLGAAALLTIAWTGAAQAQQEFRQTPTLERTTSASLSSFRFQYRVTSVDDALLPGRGTFCTAIEDSDDFVPVASGAAALGLPVRCAGTILGRIGAPTSTAGGTPVSNPSGFFTNFRETVSVPRSVARRVARERITRFFFVRDVTLFEDGQLETVGIGIELRPVTAGAQGPLAISESSIFGLDNVREVFPNGRVRVRGLPDGKLNFLIRLNPVNAQTGQTFARLRLTGQGRITGWWEVAEPGVGELSDIDLAPIAQLSSAQRAQRRVLRRVKRINFRIRPNVREQIIPGPKYSELPARFSGRHQLVLRLDQQFAGGVATTLLPLQYTVPASGLAPRDYDPVLSVSGAGRAARLQWDVPRNTPNTLRMLWRTAGGRNSLSCEGVSFLRKGSARIPSNCVPVNAVVELTPVDQFETPVGPTIKARVSGNRR